MPVPFDYKILGSDEETEYLVKVNAFPEGTGIRLHVTIFNDKEPIDQVSFDYNSQTKGFNPLNKMANQSLYASVIFMLEETFWEWNSINKTS